MEGSSERGRAVSDFKGRHFGGEIVLWAVRWYCRYGISYRDLEQMMAERGVSVDHSNHLPMGAEVRARDREVGCAGTGAGLVSVDDLRLVLLYPSAP